MKSTNLHIPWNIIFYIAIWCIWIHRNKLVHGESSTSLGPDFIMQMANQIKDEVVETVIFIKKNRD